MINVVRVGLIKRALDSVRVDVDRHARYVLDGLKLDVTGSSRFRRVEQSKQIRLEVGPVLLLVVA